MINVAGGNTQNSSLIVSEVTSWSITDADCFSLHDTYYRVLQEDDSGDVLFPLHEKCIQIADRALEFQQNTRATFGTESVSMRLYTALKTHYCHARSKGKIMFPDALGIITTCDLFSYRTIETVESIEWWSGAYEVNRNHLTRGITTNSTCQTEISQRPNYHY